MLKTPLVWKAEPGSAFSAQLGNLITYHAITQTDGYPAYVEIRGQRGGIRRLDLGFYVTMEHAEQACERHYEEGGEDYPLTASKSARVKTAHRPAPLAQSRPTSAPHVRGCPRCPSNSVGKMVGFVRGGFRFPICWVS